MDTLSKLVLSAFDDAHKTSLDWNKLSAETQDYEGSGEQLREVVDNLVAQGLLRNDSGKFARTEAGRLTVAAPRDLTLLTRPGCHLCDEMKKQIAPVVKQQGAHLREVNVDDDPVLRARYNEEVPVLFLGSRKVAKYAADLEQLRRQLEQVK